MFSIQKMLDDIGRKRQEQRFVSQSKDRLKEALEQVYGAKIERLRTIFPAHRADTVPGELPRYIEVHNLKDIGVNALLVCQTIEVAQVPRYIMTIREGRDETSWQHYEKGALHTLLKHDQELSGMNMRLLTNDVELVFHLANAGFNPPCPWVAFYELGPFVGSMQGNAEYWYRHIWDRFWESLSLADQIEFLERQRYENEAYMSADEWQDWVDGVRFRDARTRNSVSSGEA
ncbi:hypothetical protein [Paraburkholderia sp. J12]|uniref:hypothetical protein n=1 Tax=Paraburkholderia sp. J12 TaxID=2805432 RepID=UPI002ABD8900|nr:hypothetical protein [Paraburkholderia sp. J12]